jgi:hypothetical protein
MPWYYGIRASDKQIQIFEANRLPSVGCQTLTCDINGVEYQCIHGGKYDWTEMEALEHSRLHGKIKR